MELKNPPKKETFMERGARLLKQEYGEDTGTKRWRVIEFYPDYRDYDDVYRSGRVLERSEWFYSLSEAQEFMDAHKPRDVNLWGVEAVLKMEAESLYEKHIPAHTKRTWVHSSV